MADGRMSADGSALPLNADAAVLAGTLKAGETVRHTLATGRAAYLVPATGSVTVNGILIETRDGVAITDEATVDITATEDAQIVLVDVLA